MSGGAPPIPKVGPGEAEDESSLRDQSVQRCFSCARASSVLTLGSEVGRAGQDTDPRLELGLGWGAPGSGKPWTLLRNNSGVEMAARGSSRRRRQEVSCGRTWAPDVADTRLPCIRAVICLSRAQLHCLSKEDKASPIAVKRLSWLLRCLA